MAAIRICPERDTACPHGVNCPWAKDRHSCQTGWRTDLTPRAAPSPERADTVQAGGLTELTRPIIGIENRSALEVFDIMSDRIRGHWAAISDAMVERGARALMPHAFSLASPDASSARYIATAKANARACLEAALQPGGGE